MKINRLEDWISHRTHIERIGVLLSGFLVIYILWYVLFESPLKTRIQDAETGLSTVQMQLASLNSVAKKMTADTAKTSPSTSAVAGADMHYSSLSLGDNSQVMKAILQPQTNVQFTSFKNLPPKQGGVAVSVYGAQVEFISQYFATVAYLQNLEKLPWCLSWDSLQYRVTTYPNASVVVGVYVMNVKPLS